MEGGVEAFADCTKLLDTRDAIKISAVNSQLSDYHTWQQLDIDSVLNKKTKLYAKRNCVHGRTIIVVRKEVLMRIVLKHLIQ